MKNKEKYNKNFLEVEWNASHDYCGHKTIVRFKVRDIRTNKVIWSENVLLDDYRFFVIKERFLDEWLEEEYLEPDKSAVKYCEACGNQVW